MSSSHNAKFKRKDDVDSNKGRHLISTCNIHKGEILYCERPLISQQSLRNIHSDGVLICKNCKSYIDPSEEEVDLLCQTNQISRKDLNDYFSTDTELDDDEKENELSRILIDDGITEDKEQKRLTPCRHHCGELYCCKKCEEENISFHGHDLLCTGLIPDDYGNGDKHKVHPVIEFKVHAAQSNEIFLMVGELICTLVALRRRQFLLYHESPLNMDNYTSGKTQEVNEGDKIAGELTLKEILSDHICDFSMVPWWKVACPLLQDESQSSVNPSKWKEVQDLDKILHELCHDSSELLKNIFEEKLTSIQERSGENNNNLSEWDKATQLAIEEILNYTHFNESDGDSFQVVSELFFGKVIGSFEQNAIGIHKSSTLAYSILFNSEFRKNNINSIVKSLTQAGFIGEEEEEGDGDGDENVCIPCNDNDGESQQDEEEYEEEQYTYADITRFLSSLDISKHCCTLSSSFTFESSSLVKKATNDEPTSSSLNIDELDMIFTPLDGLAMYSTTCKMNHSCSPNIFVSYLDTSSLLSTSSTFSYLTDNFNDNHHHHHHNLLMRMKQQPPLILMWTALKEIRKGDELCISYIQNDLPFEERQSELKQNYGFDCFCTKCTDEKNQKDCGSISEDNGVSSSPDDAKENYDDLFGSDSDTDSEENGNQENDGDDCDNHNENEDNEENSDGADEYDERKAEQELQDHIQETKLSLLSATSSSSSDQSMIPLSILAPTSSYIITRGKQWLAKNTDNNHEGTEDDLKETLSKCIEYTQQRDFQSLYSFGVKGLHKTYPKCISSCPQYRAPFLFSSLSLILSCIQHHLFLNALELLDLLYILFYDSDNTINQTEVTKDDLNEILDQLLQYITIFTSESNGYSLYKGIVVVPSPSSSSFRLKPMIQDFSNDPVLKKQINDIGLKDSKGIRFPIDEMKHLDSDNTRREEIQKTFQSDYVYKKQPLVLREFASDWKAVQKWRDLDFFVRHHGHRIVPIEIGSMMSSSSSSSSSMTEKLMTMESFISSYLLPMNSKHKICYSFHDLKKDISTVSPSPDDSNTQIAYLAQHELFHQIPSLFDDINPKPNLISSSSPHDDIKIKRNIWIGTPGTRTPLHFDSYDNLLCQIVGVKYVRVYHPSQTPFLYVNSDSDRNNDQTNNEYYRKQGNMSPINCEFEEEEFEKYPLTRDAVFTETLLFPGDCLFIPQRSWHYVRSLTGSFSVNFWW